jgi:hypothetical protein
LWRSAAGDGVNTRAQARHCQSCTVSNFLVRVPLQTSLRLPQCEQRSDRLAVWETRGGRTPGHAVAADGSIARGSGRVAWGRAASVRYCSVDTIVMSRMPERRRVTDAGKVSSPNGRPDLTHLQAIAVSLTSAWLPLDKEHPCEPAFAERLAEDQKAEYGMSTSSMMMKPAIVPGAGGQRVRRARH